MDRDIIAVEPETSFNLLLTFEGGGRRRVDISKLLDFEGVFELLRDPNFFRRVCVNSEIGTIVWPNGADLCPDVLFEQSADADQFMQAEPVSTKSG